MLEGNEFRKIKKIMVFVIKYIVFGCESDSEKLNLENLENEQSNLQETKQIV